MAITAAELIARVAVDGVESSEAKLLHMGGTVDNVGLRLSRLALGATVVAGAALLGLGAVAIKSFGDFQAGITSLETGAGELHKNLGMVSDGILKMSVQTGTSTKDLIAGMYMIDSAGFTAAKGGLAVLLAATEGAKVGAASLADVANGVTTALSDYHLPASQAVAVTNDLIATVAAGKTHMADLARALSTILPTSSALGVSLRDTSAAMATMTGEGTSAASAATYLRQLLMALEAPAAKGAQALKAIGLTTGEVSSEMKTSLPGALQMIMQHLAETYTVGSPQYVEALKNIAGGSRQMQGILELTGTHLKTFEQNVNNISDAVNKGGKSIVGWTQVQGDFNTKMDQARAAVDVLMIHIGEKLLPIATQFLDWVTNVAVPNLTIFSDWFTNTAIPAMQQFAATMKTDVTNAINGSISIVQSVIDWWNQWGNYIIAVGSAITLFFIPALIGAGVQAVITGAQIANTFIAILLASGVAAIESAAKITLNFVASMILAGGEGWVAAGKLAVFTGSMITSGVEAVVAGSKIAITYVGGLITAAREGEITAASLWSSVIPALTATGTAAWAAAGPFGVLAATVIAVGATVKYEVDNMKGNVITNFNVMRSNATQAGYTMYKDTSSNAKAMATSVTTSAQNMKTGVSAAVQQMTDQTLAKLSILDNTGVDRATTFSKSVMRVFNEMKTSGIQSLSDLDASALSYLREIQGYVDAMNGQLNLAAYNTANAKTHGLLGKNQYAEGTNFAPGGMALVGERGPELVYLPRGAQVIPNHQLMSGGGSGTMSQQPLQVQVDVYMDGARTSRQLMPHIVSAIRTSVGARI